MDLRFRSIAHVTRPKPVLPITVSSFLFTALATTVFPASRLLGAEKQHDRHKCESNRSVSKKVSDFSKYPSGVFDQEFRTFRSSFDPIFTVHRVAAARGNKTITGFVFSDSRRPIPNVHVELQNDVGATVSRTKTAMSGLFAFRGLGEGVFYVKVLPYNLNYVSAERRVQLISVSARPGSGSVSEQVDFYLQPSTAPSTPFAAPGVVFVQDVPESAERLYNEGVGLVAVKSDEQGFEKFRKAIEAFPTYFAALDRLGNEYVLKGHYRPAIILLSEAIKVNPKSFSSRFGLGLAYFRLNDLDPAIANFNRATGLYRESVQANLWLGISLHAAGKYSEAEKALNVAGKLSKGESPEVHWQLARLYKDQRRLAESATQLELLLKLKPDAADADEIRKTIVILRQKSKPAS